MANHRDIEERAAAWLARRDSNAWSSKDDAELHAWLEQSTAHRVAFLRLEAAWEEARRLKALSAGLPASSAGPPEEWRQTPFFDSSRPASLERRPRRAWLTALAASVLLVAGLAIYLNTSFFRGERYSTPIGGLASIRLQDGSTVTLNTASRIHVEILAHERRVVLEEGEAFFVVAKDPNRPFIVQAGGRHVVAVGTQFSVRRDGDGLRVVVREGTVRLGSETAASGSAVPAPAAGTNTTGRQAEVRLSAGTIARARAGDLLVQKETVPQVEDILSWREGYLTFHDTTLGEAIEEFNRYNPHRILIGDPNVAAIRISGTFRPSNYEAFVRLLRDGYDLRASEAGDTTTLTKN